MADKESHSSFIINNDENDENYTVLKTEVQKIAEYLKKKSESLNI